MIPGVTRHFATLRHSRFGERQVHYRRCGSGPAVLLFHQSPHSSLNLVDTLRRWSDRFTCIAPDTPGYGQSDGLGMDSVSMNDLAAGTLELADALGIDRFAAYGIHTGAKLAAAVALHSPERVTGAVANGCLLLSDVEREEILEHYLPPFTPAWDGSHLTRMWSWQRNGLVFFPWFKAEPAHRLPAGTASLEALHAATIDFLRTGERYASGYRAAFTLRMDEVLRSMRVPLLVTVAGGDLLAPQLERLAALACSNCVRIEPGGSPEDTLNLCAEFLARHPAPAPPEPIDTTPLVARATQSMIRIADRMLRVRCQDGGTGPPVLIVHESIGSADAVDPVLVALRGHRPVITMDLPGRGESEALREDEGLSVAALGASVIDLLQAFGLHTVDLVGVGDGGVIALDAAVRIPERVRKLVLAGPTLPPPELRPALQQHCKTFEPDWHGGYLAEAWHFLRDRELFMPWFLRSNDLPGPGPIPLDPRRLTLGVLDLLRGGRRASEAQIACLGYPLEEGLQRTRHAPVLLGRAQGVRGIIDAEARQYVR
jgi:pimeloyl-ACP methyl ester carboxylesterase